MEKILSLLTSRTKLLLFSASSFAAGVQDIHFQLRQGRWTHSCWGLQPVKNPRCETEGQCRYKRGWFLSLLLSSFPSLASLMCWVLSVTGLEEFVPMQLSPHHSCYNYCIPYPWRILLDKRLCWSWNKTENLENSHSKACMSHGRTDKQDIEALLLHRWLPLHPPEWHQDALELL